MTRTNTKLTAAVEAYFADLGRVRASGGATGERSSYGPLANLLNAVGAALKPKVFCVGELADQGAGHPDFGLYAAKQVQKGRPRDGQTPERGVVEVKPVDDDAWLTAVGDQVSRYWGRYRLVLVTNTRDFVLVGEDASGRPAKLESFRLADSADDFDRRLERPRAFAPEERAAMGDVLPTVGETTFDIHLNGDAFWRNVPSAVWNYRLGGYQVLKKWLSYRELAIFRRPLRPEEVQYFTDTARRIQKIIVSNSRNLTVRAI